jgi:hypothetical protein
MRTSFGERTREVLLANPQGLTVREISKLVGSPMDLVLACLRRTYGCYIVKFIPSKSGARTYNALWCCVVVPANAIKPAEFQGAVVVDDKQADAEKRAIARRVAAKKQRAKQKLANQKIREAAKEKPTPPEYKPQKTAWVSVPSWSSVGAST